MDRTKKTRGIVALLLAALLLSFPARALAEFVVNGTGDSTDKDSVLTLREAILLANGGTGPNGLDRALSADEAGQVKGCILSGAFDSWTIFPGFGCGEGAKDTIDFDLQSCPCAILPNSVLPPTTEPVVIDGYSQPGSLPNSAKIGSNADFRIFLSGVNAGTGAYGLQIAGGDSTVKGLVIADFDGHNLELTGNGDNLVSGNFITESGHDGILINSSGNIIGGSGPQAHNVINLSGGNGIEVTYGNVGNLIQTNWIGTGTNGKDHQGNDHAGISIHGTDTTVSECVIANNLGNGIEVVDGFYSDLRLNRIFDNVEMSIDLGGDGVTKNDNLARDGDLGPNDLQNYPVVRGANHLTATIKGKLVSTPNTTFLVDLWSSPICNNVHHGQGRTGLATIQLTTNKNGVARFKVQVSTPFDKGSFISATATAPDNSTSEFSACRTAN